MKRCLPPPLSRFLALVLVVASWTAACLSAPALAQTTQRHFPQAAQRGLLEVTAPPNVLLDGKPDRLSPGARIRNANNLLVLSASLVGQTLLITYVREPFGLIHEVWILNEREAQEKSSGPNAAPDRP